MLDSVSTLNLGPTLYMPALHPDIVEVGSGRKYKELRSLIYCTEDSILERDLPDALRNLAISLPQLGSAPVSRFIRPRNPKVLSELLALKGMENINGFIIPKADLDTLPAYFDAIEPHERFSLMITLETEAAFDLMHLYRLRDFLVRSPLRKRITAIRIGAQDLLSLLGIRRVPEVTMYETPMGTIIDQFLMVFRPAGFTLAAPVFEYFNSPELLRRELEADIARGLFGKAALHPDQISIIADAYKASAQEVEAAQAILDTERPAVFRLHDRMYEKAVHTNWARTIEDRARIYGIKSV